MIIKFSVNGDELAKFPLFMWKNSRSYLMWLDGLDITIGAGLVTPIYRSLFSVERHPGQLAISIYIGRYGHMFIFQKSEPFLHYEKFKAEIEEMDYE